MDSKSSQINFQLSNVSLCALISFAKAIWGLSCLGKEARFQVVRPLVKPWLAHFGSEKYSPESMKNSKNYINSYGK